MKQITVNLRVDLISVISCADFIVAQGVDTTIQPMSTTVRAYLETITEFMRIKGQCPDYEDYTDDMLIDRYNELFKEKLTEVKNLDLGGIEDFRQTKEVDISDTRDTIVEKAVALMEGDNFVEISREAGEDVDIPVHTFDLFAIDGMDWDSILDLAPDNPYVLLEKKSPDPTRRKAIEVVFGKVQMSNWDNDSTRALIADLMARHIDTN